MDLNDLENQVGEAVQRLAARFAKMQEEVTGIPKRFKVEVRTTEQKPERFGLRDPSGEDAEAERLRRNRPFPPPPGGGGGGFNGHPCYGESVNIEFRPASGGGSQETTYCRRALMYKLTSDGAGGKTWSNRTAYDTGDAGCFPSGSTAWWYAPSDSLLNAALTNMVTPPNTAIAATYNVIFYFFCTRKFERGGGSSPRIPSTDETGSGVYCYAIYYKAYDNPNTYP